jgi:hypothetical protein
MLMIVVIDAAESGCLQAESGCLRFRRGLTLPGGVARPARREASDDPIR